MIFKYLRTLLTVCLFLLLSYHFGLDVLSAIFGYEPHPESSWTTCEVVRARGLKCEEYSVPTKNGYVLTIHRIPPLLGVSRKGLKPVLIQHGLTGTSLNFVISSEDFSTDPRAGIGHNLGLELARFGYDVWLNNNRGSHFSMKHLHFDSNDSRFWNYTFDDISRDDMPDVIDFVLAQTKSPKLSYIGHSQGTMVMFALLSNSSQTRFNDVIEPFIALSPVAILKNATSSFRYVVSAMKRFNGDNLDVPVFDRPRPYQKVKKFICNSRTKVLCKLLFMSICGFSDQTNNSRLGVYMSEHSPSSTSRRNLRHFNQLFNSDKFHRFDYGPEGNMEKYSQQTPPEYELEKISHKSIHLIYTLNDLFAPLDAVKILESRIKTIKESYEVQDSSASHCDPLFGMDVSREVNHKILQILNSYV